MNKLRIAASLGLALVLAGCATQPTPSGGDLPGFFSGIWNGFSAPFALIGSIFWDIRVYAFPNSGGWYDFGYFLGFWWVAAVGISRHNSKGDDAG